MKLKTNILLLISSILVVLAFVFIYFLQDIGLSKEQRVVVLACIFLPTLLLNCIGIFVGIFETKKNLKKSFIGIIGNSLIIALFFTVFLISKFQKCTITEFNKFEFNQSEIPDKSDIKILSFADCKECTTDETYYYSVIAVVIETMDTIRILTPCQLLSNQFQLGTYNQQDTFIDSILVTYKIETSGKEKYVVTNSKLPFQDGDYPVAVGSIGFRDENNKMLIEELKEQSIDTNLILNQKEINTN